MAGCYTYTPLYSAPTPGTRVALELNDRGRVALEQNVGPEVASIEGVIRSVDDSQLVVSMEAAKSLYGSRSRWNGELVVFRTEHVRTLRERRYSGPRTLALVTALASGTVAFIATRGLLGGGSDDGGTGPGGGGPPGGN